MTDVKWIKMKVGMFDGESFKKIKRARIGGESFRDKLTAIWFELMDFAGKCNHDGAFINSREIPFSTVDDIAIMIDREPDELELCMQFYINEGMVEIIDDIYMLSAWNQYQNGAELEKIREKKRISQQKWRAKKKALNAENVENVDSTVESTNSLLSNSLSNSLSISNSKEKGGVGGKEKPVKHKYGQYSNVLLSDEELDKLKAEFPSDWGTRIERLSEYIASTGKTYKSHLATIRAWARRDSDRKGGKNESTGGSTGSTQYGTVL